MSYFSSINLKYFQSLEVIEDFWTDCLSKLSHIFCAFIISTHYLWHEYWKCITQSMIKSSQNELTSCIWMKPSNASKMYPFSICIVVHATTSWTWSLSRTWYVAWWNPFLSYNQTTISVSNTRWIRILINWFLYLFHELSPLHTCNMQHFKKQARWLLVRKMARTSIKFSNAS